MVPVKSAADLYGLPLDEFTAERDALAKQLRSDGDGAQAEEIKKLRKPSTAAWAVNQLVRTQQKAVADLFKAGDEMIQAQEKALGGKGSVDALRAATQKQRGATEKLLEAAAGLLSSDGHELPASVQERVSETLRAAAVDPDSREQVRTGCLAKELQFTGLAGFGVGAAAPNRPRGKGPAVAKGPSRGNDADRKATERKSAERKAAEQEEAERKATAKRRREAAEEKLREAKQRLSDAKKELAGAERELRTAERTREKAAAAVERAEQQLEKLQRGGR